jgi:phosphatidylserine decarboxylase
VGVLWGWAVSFFRDPARRVDRPAHVLFAPADGKITAIDELDEHPAGIGPCVRIRIFLSLFNVHINRMPCATSVRSIEMKPGKFLNAMKPESSDLNESNTLILEPEAPYEGPMVLRQIAGLIARTIVCHAKVGDRFASGDRIGMIKFGSGTELVLPKQAGLTWRVEVGQTVRAGLTPLAEIRS